MSTNAGPVRVPLERQPPAKPAAAGKPGGLGKLLATRNGKIAAAAGLVVIYALYRRYKSNAAAAANAAGADTTNGAASSGAGVPTANTLPTDLYSQLEPLVENASGYSGTASILKQLQTLQDSLTKGQTTGSGTTGSKSATSGAGTTTATPHGPLFPDQIHAVGVVGQRYDLMQQIARFYPTATAQQRKEIGFATIANDPSLGTGVIPGGYRVRFYSHAVK